MSKYALKIRTCGNDAKVISVLRKFDPSLPISEIRKHLRNHDFALEYDLLHYDLTEEMAGIDRISRFSDLIGELEKCGAETEIYAGGRMISRRFFQNSMQTLREIALEVETEMDEEAEE